jgi:L-Ala-D/L-Glu epimerase
MAVITYLSAAPLILPLTEPFRVATRTAYEARNVLVRISCDNNEVGLGGAAPVEYVTGETIDSVIETLTNSAGSVAGLSTDNLDVLLLRAEELIPAQPAARAALEMALYDLWAKCKGVSLWRHFGGASKAIVSDLTIPIVAPVEAARKARDAWGAGFEHLKIKVGDPNGVDADRERLTAVCSAAPGARLRIDANQAFSPDAAVDFIEWATEISQMIELVEQPVAKLDFAGLAYVRSKLDGGPPIFADESAQTSESAAELIRLDAVDGINVKIMKSGLAGALRIASLCRSSGIKLMVGCMLESRLSLTAACAIAAGTGWFDHIDIDAHHLLQPSSIFKGGFADSGSRLSPSMSEPGWGVTLDAAEWNKSKT